MANIGLIEPTAANQSTWIRKAAERINFILRRFGGESVFFPVTSSPPANPVEGQAYYDSALHKLRVYDGTSWQNAW